MSNADQKKGMFSRIETREDALNVVRESSTGFFVLAAIQGGLGFFVAPSLLIDAVAFLVFGAVLRKWHSRTAAVLLLLFSLGSGSVTVMNRLGMMSEGGSNVILAAITLIIAVRAVEATFKLHGSLALQTTAQTAPSIQR